MKLLRNDRLIYEKPKQFPDKIPFFELGGGECCTPYTLQEVSPLCVVSNRELLLF